MSLRSVDWRLTPLVDVVCQITPRVMKTFHSLSAAGRALCNQGTSFVLATLLVSSQPWKGSPAHDKAFKFSSGNCVKIDIGMPPSSAITNFSVDPMVVQTNKVIGRKWSERCALVDAQWDTYSSTQGHCEGNTKKKSNECFNKGRSEHSFISLNSANPSDQDKKL